MPHGILDPQATAVAQIQKRRQRYKLLLVLFVILVLIANYTGQNDLIVVAFVVAAAGAAYFLAFYFAKCPYCQMRWNIKSSTGHESGSQSIFRAPTELGKQCINCGATGDSAG